MKCVVYTMKDGVYPEITPEIREEINRDVAGMCAENAEYGYKQGVRNTLLGVSAGAMGLAIGTVCYYVAKKKQLKKAKGKD